MEGVLDEQQMHISRRFTKNIQLYHAVLNKLQISRCNYAAA